jgi:hypothetical protein
MIGIYAPYDHSDTTTMALSLADYAISLGHSVSIFSFRDRETDVHPVWDRKIKHRKTTSFVEWAANCSHITWFAYHPGLVYAAKKEGCRNSLVVLREFYTSDYNVTPDIYESVLVPSVYVQVRLQAKWGAENIYPLLWDPGGPINSKHMVVDKDKIRVFMPLQNKMAEGFGHKLMFALNMLMSDNSKVHLTIARQKRFNAATQTAVSELTAEFGNRVRVVKMPGHNLRAIAYAQHDWTLYPATCDDAYIPAIQSLFAGTPVVTMALTPAIECVIHGHSGYTIRGTKQVDPVTELPIGMSLRVRDLVEGLTKSIGDPVFLARLLDTPWPFLEMRRRTFQEVWKTIWSELPERAK